MGHPDSDQILKQFKWLFSEELLYFFVQKVQYVSAINCTVTS